MLALLVLTAIGGTAGAQIVNVQGFLAKPPAENGVTVQAELKIDWREGNTQLFNIGGSGTVLLKHDKWLGLLAVRGELGTSNDIEFAKKTFEHVRARYTLSCVWRWEVFAQHDYDQFRRLSVRGLFGTGPALQIVNVREISVLAGLAYMYEVEKLDDRMGTVDAGTKSNAHRASAYLTGSEKLTATADVVQTLYVQPRIDDFTDIRLLGELAIAVKLSRRVALTDSFTVAFDATPPQGVKTYDTQLKLGLVVTL
jgi:hypothetical protein